MNHRIVRLLIASSGILGCLLGIWIVGRAGLSRMLSVYVLKASFLPAEYRVSSLASGDEAIRLTPSDPTAHHARAVALMDEGELDEAIKELERAMALSPEAYELRLKLGNAREEANDEQGAIAAYSEGVRLAPNYALPRWLLGNLLLRTGRLDEGAVELQRATASDPTLLPAAIDLVWAMFDGDARAVVRAFKPQNAYTSLALAHFLVSRKKASEAVALFRAASGEISKEERNLLISSMISTKQFREAYEVWSSAWQMTPEELSGMGAIVDGGFERDIDLNDVGFGWRVSRDVKAVNISLDAEQQRTGAQSLRIAWNGNSSPGAPVLSRLVLVESNARYRLNFSTRTQDIVTGGLPVIEVVDANANQSLAQSSALLQGTNGWQDHGVEFATAETITEIKIIVRRQGCSSEPCPIFGHLWLDDFQLKRL